MIRSPNAKERGAALIFVLLLVAIMSAIIAVSFDRVSLAIRRERSRSVSDEARFDLVSGEAIAVQKLTDVLALNPTDSAAFLGKTLSLPTPRGRLSGQLNDGGNCFNLNSLVTAQPNGALVAQPIAVGQFARLLEFSGASAANAAIIAQSSADWIDSDSVALPGGHEDDSYLQLRQPYRTPNALLSDPGELNHVMGMEKSLYDQIAPLLCALPEAALSVYNVNSLRPSQAALVAAILPRAVTPQMVGLALRNRPTAGFAAYQDLLAQPSLKSFVAPGEVDSQLRVKSVWFRLDMMAEHLDIETSETALIDARLLPARLIRRTYGVR
jgi:general secretion pathway protein K